MFNVVKFPLCIGMDDYGGGGNPTYFNPPEKPKPVRNVTIKRSQAKDRFVTTEGHLIQMNQKIPFALVVGETTTLNVDGFLIKCKQYAAGDLGIQEMRAAGNGIVDMLLVPEGNPLMEWLSVVTPVSIKHFLK